MSLESAIADLVSASTKLTQSVNVTRATVEATRDSAIAKEAPVTTAKDATAASATAATTNTATTASKLAAAAADYAAQKTTKGLAVVQTSADSELKDRLHRRDPARHPFRGARPSLVMDFVRRECHRNNAAGNLEPVDLNSFMTFTRGSTATYVGPDGLIKTAGVNEARYGYDPVTGEALGLLVEEQRTNLCPYGTFFSKWITTGNGALYFERAGVVSPDGTLNATKITNPSAANLYAYQAYTCAAPTGTRFTVSVYSTTAVVGLCSFAGLSQVTSDTLASTPCGGGWYRHTLTGTTTVDNAVVDIQITIWANSSVVVWGAQLEAGSFPTSYIPTPATFTGRASTKTYFDSNGVMQTAASGVAATDYGYVDGRWVSKGLSLEPQATNLWVDSACVTDWIENDTASVVTQLNNAYVSPTGSLAGKKITFSSGSFDTAGVYRYIPSVILGTQLTASVFIRRAAAGVARFYWEGSVAYGGTRQVDISAVTGAVSAVTGAGSAMIVSVVAAGPDWFRVSLTRTTIADGGGTFCAYSGVAGVNEFGLWGAQLETGPVATSYIPTTTAQVTRAADTSTSAQVTRAADSAVSTQAAALYNLDAGTTCVEAKYSNRGTYPGLYSWDLDYFIFTAAAVNQLILNGRGSAGTMGLTPPAVDTTLRHAVRRNRLNLKSAVNNSALTGTSLSLSPTTTVTMLRLGVGTEYWNGYIRQLTYFPRQLSDADLQALTILED